MSIGHTLTIRGAAALLAAVALVACMAPGGTAGRGGGGAAMDQPGGAMSGGQSGAATMGSAPSGQMSPGTMDMGQMCAMHRNMHNAPAEQRQAMLEQQMTGMSPEMRQRHMEMMQKQCQ